MKWLGRWLVKIAQQVDQEDRKIMGASVSMAVPSADRDWEDGLNIRVHTAKGGRIVSFNRYDRKTDRNQNNVYVIPDDHDFERELGKLITLESMRG